jgi:tetratricopeptide (TPR) repeat protein
LFILAFVADATGRVEEAMNIYKSGIERSGEKPEKDVQYAYFRARIGDRTGAEQQLKTMLDSKNKPSPYDAAEIYAALGEKDKAFENLETAFKEKYSGLSYILVDPALEPLQSDDRFKDLVKRMNFPE